MDFSQLDLSDHQVLAKVILKEALRLGVSDRESFHKLRNRFVKRDHSVIFHNLYFVKAYESLVSSGEIEENVALLSLIRKRSVRTMSGVAPVTVLTKAWPCPGKCVYCPTDVRMPKSYLASQPAAARGLGQGFDPYKQVLVRLRALEMTGHEVSKVELRIIGGTWSAYPKAYQTWFVKRCLEAMNDWSLRLPQSSRSSDNSPLDPSVARSATSPLKLEETCLHVGTLSILPEDCVERIVSLEEFDSEVVRNETASVRCIGINIETRPDFVDLEEVKRLRWLGVTKVEMGVQTTSDYVQALTMRGHDLAAVRHATRLLKDSGFKVSYHMMPNLPGSNPDQDVEDFQVLFSDSDYCPDYVKIYPCVVIPETILGSVSSASHSTESDALDFRNLPDGHPLRELEKVGYRSYSDEELIDVLIRVKRLVPEWCRIDRLMRDIPKGEIQSGSELSNIRQIVQERMRHEFEKKKKHGKIKCGVIDRGDLLKSGGWLCRCIRCREIFELVSHPSDVELVERRYEASGGIEVFLSFEDVKLDRVVGLLRLRLKSYDQAGKRNDDLVAVFPELEGCALVREVHVYGEQTAVDKKSVSDSRQHMGFGKRLMEIAEEKARDAGLCRLAVISGIGTREYYRKLGYRLEGAYMVKDVCDPLSV